MEELPPGYRFYPTEEELVSFYLRNKLEGGSEYLNHLIDRIIPVVDIYEFEPSNLPQLSGELCHGDLEQWFFFIPRQEKEAQGGRPNRLTNSGYWKATGSPGNVFSSDNRVIGVKKTMVFYEGRAPCGRKTEWKLNEYSKAIDGEATPSNAAPQAVCVLSEFRLCRLYIKSKCLRAFDRRPSGVVMGAQKAQQVLQAPQGTAHEATTSRQNPRALEGVSSHESSSSADHGDHRHNPPQAPAGESSGNQEMAVDSEPLWDWDDMNWF